MTNYTVKRPRIEDYDNCQKHHLRLEKDGEKVVQQRVSFTKPRQLEDGKYNSRVRQWAEKRIAEDVNRQEINLDLS